MTPQNSEPEVCPAHGTMIAKLEHIGDLLGAKIDGLREEVRLRMEESSEDRRELHAQHNLLAREVTAAMTKLNGATLLKLSAHQRSADGGQDSIHFRKSDSVGGWLRENWLIITAITAAAFAGEKVIPALLKMAGTSLGISP